MSYMKESKLKKLEQAEKVFAKEGIYFQKKANGHYRIDSISYWATTETYIDHETGEKGVGLDSLLEYMKE